MGLSAPYASNAISILANASILERAHIGWVKKLNGKLQVKPTKTY